MEHNIITDIQTNEGSQLTHLYNQYREQFLAYGIKRFSLPTEVLADIYQESFIALYNNIRNGRLTNLTCSIKTYLFKIGTNQILQYLKQADKQMNTSPDEFITEMARQYDSEEWIRKQELVYDIVSALEHPCNRILALYYWQQKKMNDIARIMGYKNEQVARNRKLSCMKRLKTYIVEQFKKEDLL